MKTASTWIVALPVALVSLMLIGCEKDMSKSKSSSSFTNHLAGQKSPYLLQHEHNPVVWYPWGEEAFAKARKENKPIFLSIGYSTCHWCHVMAHESFEDPHTAEILNKHFVSIKVDREERPDVDQIYMTYIQAVTGAGGWPMSVFLTPDLKPFFGGTYFPPMDNYGRTGFPTVLNRVADLWEKDHAKVVSESDKIFKALQTHESTSTTEGKLDTTPLEVCYRHLARTFDSEDGGWGNAPKFPRPVTLNFLFREATRKGAAAADKQHALEMALFTLKKMAAGGMHDHLGGGFHRYAVDSGWHVPHFEKMLYDQAQLAIAYLEAYQITHEAIYADTARDILAYVQRDLTSPEGGFYSAEDADSLIEEGKPEHAEGAFYVWTQKEIESVLGAHDAKVFDYIYGVEPDGNAPEGTDAQGELTGKNVLIQRHTIAEAAAEFKMDTGQIGELLATARPKLLQTRNKRPRPHLDDKIITAWNGLMISAFARAYDVLGDESYLKSADDAAAFVEKQLYHDGELIRSYRHGASQVRGFVDDYASLIQGLLDLYESDFDIDHLKLAAQLQKKQDELFWDEKEGGYFSTSANDKNMILRMKEDYDGAEPSPNSVAALNLQRLAAMLDRSDLGKKLLRTMGAFSALLKRSPIVMPQMLVALDFSQQKPQQIVLAGKTGDKSMAPLLKEIHNRFLPHTVLLAADGGDGQKYLSGLIPFLKEVKPIDGKPAAYVCENFTCQLPVNDAKALAKLLDSAKK